MGIIYQSNIYPSAMGAFLIVGEGRKAEQGAGDVAGAVVYLERLFWATSLAARTLRKFWVFLLR